MTCSTFGGKCGGRGASGPGLAVSARPSFDSSEASASMPNPMEPRDNISRRLKRGRMERSLTVAARCGGPYGVTSRDRKGASLGLPDINEFLQVEQRMAEIAPRLLLGVCRGTVLRAQRLHERRRFRLLHRRGWTSECPPEHFAHA